MEPTLALVINPVAGLGGPAGLIGSDGSDVQRDAVARGASPRAEERAVQALRVLAASAPETVVLTARGEMGENAVRAAGLTPRVVWPSEDRVATQTTGADTAAAVRAFSAAGADLVLFAGGDGTARDVCAAEIPHAVLGIPAGVKMYSACFAVTPVAAGALAAAWMAKDVTTVVEREVLDIDEDALRRSRVEPQLFGTVRVPDQPARTQARKAPSPQSEHHALQTAARGGLRALQPDVYYLLGPGSTMALLAQELGVSKTPLGVDVVHNGRLVIAGASEQQLLDFLPGRQAQAVVTIIGGQGFLLGRGNQQISARVIRLLGEEPLLVVATDQKLVDLGGTPLIVDTGDPETDTRLAAYVRVITGPTTSTVYPVVAPEALGVTQPPSR